MSLTDAATNLSEPSDRLDAGYSPPHFTIEAVELVIELDAALTLVTAELRFRRLASDARDLALDGRDLRLVSIALDGASLPDDRFEATPDRLLVRDAPPEGTLSLRLQVRPGGPGMEGLIDLDGVLVTHCEPEGFRRICYFVDRPDVMARYRVTLVADAEAYPTLLCNGEPVETARRGDGRHSVTWQDDIPKGSYLFALAAGRFTTLEDSFTTMSGRVVPIAVHAAASDLSGCAHGLETLKAAMAWDERTFGVEYERGRFNVVVMRNYPGGGMENPSLNLYATEFFQADPAFSTDAELRRITSSVAHEYFHEWSGNRVGCRSWLDLTAKEGLTVLRQQRFMADLIGPDARIDDVIFLRANQYPEDDGELAHPIRPASAEVASNLYTRTVYEKGAEVLRMLAAWVGEAAFDEAVRAWFARFDGRAGTVEDFLEVTGEVTGTDVSSFRSWWRLVGPVALDASCALTVGAGRLQLAQRPLRSQLAHLPPLPIPVRVGLVSADGGAREASLVRMSTLAETIELPGVAQGSAVSLLRGHSAEVRLFATVTTDDLALLAQGETDPVARWDAAQELARRAVLAWKTDGAAGAAATAWLRLGAQLLADPLADPGGAGRLLALPTEASLGLGQSPVDVDGLRAARGALTALAGRVHADQLVSAYGTLAAAAADPAGVGPRRLRNLALEWRARAGDPAAPQLALAQLGEAPSMEDQASALRVLVDHGPEARAAGLALARRRWVDDARKLDNLYAVEGASAAPDVADRVRGLLDDPSFDLAHAVRVKALLDAFAANQGGFHAVDGAGYRAMGGAIGRLGGRNPRLASRFLKPFGTLLRFDPGRCEAMVEVLSTLDARPDLAVEPRSRLRAILALGRR